MFQMSATFHYLLLFRMIFKQCLSKVCSIASYWIDSPFFESLDVLQLDRSEDPMVIPDDLEIYTSKLFADSLTQISFKNHPTLRKLFLSYYSFMDAMEFLVENMPVLELISIGSDCLRQSDLLIRNCPHLKSIMVNDKSFVQCKKIVLQGLFMYRVISRSSTIRVSLFWR